MERSSKFLIVSQPKYKIIRRRTPPPPIPLPQVINNGVKLTLGWNASRIYQYFHQTTLCFTGYLASIQTVYLLIRSDEKVYKLKRYTNNRSNEGLTLETSAFLPFTVANLRFQLSC